MIAVLLTAASLLAAAPAATEPLAAPRRVAVLVGANRGAAGRATLRYSYRDAREMADVLTEVGQFAPADVHVLEDPEPAAVLALLDRELAALKGAPESLLVFYYSGHADARALYPNGELLPFGELRARLESESATLRVGIIDACSGGGWTGAKGVHPDAPFAVDVPLQLSSEGSVLIASSSGLENAHESERIDGSFFTHHLVAALRGAGDSRGDGVVTVTEAFNYAKERTIRDSAQTADPQHPSFSMNLRGRSDLPLTRLAGAQTLVQVRERRAALQLIQLSTGLVVLEVPPGKPLMLSVPPGDYLVRRQDDDGVWTREISVAANQPAQLDEAQLVLTSEPSLATKGGGGAGHLFDLNAAQLGLGGQVQLELELPLSQRFTLYLAPELTVPLKTLYNGGSGGQLGGSAGVHFFPGRETLHGAWLGAQARISAGTGSDDATHYSLVSEGLTAEAGYGFFLAPNLGVSLGAGATLDREERWNVINTSVVLPASQQGKSGTVSRVELAARIAAGYAW